jgi:putative serine protease PepD
MNLLKHPRAAVAAAVAAAAVGASAGTYGLVGGGDTVVRQVTVQSGQAAADATTTVGAVYEQASKAVVEITVGSSGGSGLGGQGTQQAQGSGFVLDKEGHIVTNQHVVDGATSVEVRFWNDETATATVVGSDASTDLAVLEVDTPASQLHPLELADSADVKVGDAVIAIGSPFGLDQTVTTGIVSALHREITAPNNFAIADAIQTDAAINHGNSGGPLLDAEGRVIGVNSQIESESGGNDGVGFAVPSNTVKSIAAQLISSGQVEHAYLGVGIEGVAGGARVTSVAPGTPAAKAGLRVGDVITAVDGESVGSDTELRSLVDAHQAGDSVAVTYRRGDGATTVDVTLGTRPSS